MSLSARAYFNPTQISGCQLWLDAADTSSTSMTFSSGSNLSVWKDKSTSANNFNLISGTPNSVVDGGKNAVYIPSGAVMRSVNQLTVTTSSAYFIVCKLITVGSGSVQEINDILQLINIVVGAYIPFIRFYQGVLQGSATPGNPGNTNDLGNGNYYVNGTFNPNFDSSYYLNKYVIIGLVNPNVGGTTYLSISDTSYPRPFLGNIGEIICYPGGVTSTQRQQLEGYLSQKWGIQGQLPQGHVGISYPFYRAVKNTFTTQTYFNPLSIAGCQFWLDGSDNTKITTSGGYITQIIDKAVGVTLTATGTTLTTTTINGVQSLNFPGTSYLSGTGSNPSSAYMFFVFTVNSLNNNGYYPIFSWHFNVDVANIVCFGYPGSPTIIGFYESSQGGQTPTTPVTVGTTYLMAASYNGTATTLAVNGAITPTAGSQPTPATAGSTSNVYIGVDYGPNIITINLGEVIVYTSSISDTQRQTIESYLAQKWGLTTSLPSNHLNSTAPAATPRTSVALVRGTANASYANTPYYNVTPVAWSYNWQKYLQSLVAANSSGVTATFSTSIVNGATPGSDAYGGGVLAPNGKIYCIPASATAVGVIDPTANTFTTPVSGSAPGSIAYIGGVLAPNGKIYCIPYAATAVGVIDPVLNTFTTTLVSGSASGGGAYRAGVLAPNGKIYCMPNSATNIGVIDPVANTFTTFGTVTDAAAHEGGVLAPNGKIYCIPYYSTTVGVIDPVVNTFTTFGTAPGGGAYRGGVLAANGKIYCIPAYATTVGVIDPVLNTFTTFGTTPGGIAYIGGILAPNGKIYCISFASSTIGVIDPVLDSFSSFAIPSAGAMYGGVLGLNGNIYCIPLTGTSVGVISFTGLKQLPSLNYCLSAYTNKL